MTVNARSLFSPLRAQQAAPQDDLLHADGHHELADSELLSVFLGEGQELLTQIGTCLQLLRQTPGDAAQMQLLLRALHTIKGSARLVGAAQLAAHMHAMESRLSELNRGAAPSASLHDTLLSAYDVGQQLFESWCGLSAVDAADSHVRRTATVSTMRMRADVVDSLLAQIDEISLSQRGMVAQTAALRQDLSALADQVTQLDAQLRRIDSRPQRMPRMAPRAGQIHVLHQSLSATIGAISNQLVKQADLTRTMQRVLLHSGMVPFGECKERMQRLVRQLAGETGKALALEVHGGALEIDRSIVEKMQAPIEHLLRNAAVHGVESAIQRQASGKNPTAKLCLEVAQEGNALMIRLSDDGRGLPWQRIREQAVRKGLLVHDQSMSEDELAALIFHPGFSTHAEITELAGRGIGLDVVRAEVSALAGRIKVSSVNGQGTAFTIDLPLAQALTQVVLVQAGPQRYAVPSRLVVQVLRLDSDALVRVLHRGQLQWQGGSLPAHSLRTLLGGEPHMPVAEAATVLIIKNDESYMALLAERLIGSHAVMIKNGAGQLPGIIGMLGATVLADGVIALILDPPALVQRQVDREQSSPIK